jgi:PASTA domain
MQRGGQTITRRALVAAAALAVALVIAPAARGEQVTLGPDLESLSSPGGLQPACFDDPCTFLQSTGPVVVSSVNGLVTSWSLRTYAATPKAYRLRIVRGPAALGQSFMALRTSAFAPAFSAEGIHTQQAALPIAAGDRIALRGGDAGSSVTGGQAWVPPAGTDATMVWTDAMDDPADGGSGTPTSGPAHLVVGVSATVSFCRVPAVTGKRLKRAKRLTRKAGCAPAPKRRSAKPSLPPRKLNRVFKQRPAAGKTVRPGTKVKLFFRR